MTKTLTRSNRRNDLRHMLDEMRSAFSNDLFLDTFEPFMVKNGSYPPYNIVKEDDHTSTIEMALAGFNKKDIDVQLDGNILTISSKTQESGESEDHHDGREYTYRGIAKRSFSSKFRLSEYPEITECKLRDGILRITVTQNIPEEKLPKAIEIK